MESGKLECEWTDNGRIVTGANGSTQNDQAFSFGSIVDNTPYPRLATTQAIGLCSLNSFHFSLLTPNERSLLLLHPKNFVSSKSVKVHMSWNAYIKIMHTCLLSW